MTDWQMKCNDQPAENPGCRLVRQKGEHVAFVFSNSAATAWNVQVRRLDVLVFRVFDIDLMQALQLGNAMLDSFQ